MQEKQVINGTFGEVWVNDDYVGEVTGLVAAVDIEFEDVSRPRKLSTGKKMTSWSGTGTLSLNKMTSRFIKLLTENLKAGRQTTVEIISKLEDPDALGAERIHLKEVTFENLSLANWQAKTVGTEETNFSFGDFEPIDLIDE